MASTHPYIPRISVVFDFDSTLATDTLDAIVESMGMSRDDFDEQYVEPLGDGWDGILRRGYALIEAGKACGRPVTLDLLEEASARVKLFYGVLKMPERLRHAAQGVDPDIEVEYVVLSSGYAEIIKATGIGELFGRVWAGTFAYENGEAIAVKRIIAHPEKALYLEALGKGITVDDSNGPENAGTFVADEDMHTPFDQMIYVGDGLSDLNAFGFLTGRGGTCVAIDKGSHFDQEEQMDRDQRVDDLAEPSYGEDSELLDSLRHAVLAAAHRISIRKLSRGQ